MALVEDLRRENERLRLRVEELEKQVEGGPPPASAPPWVKPPVPAKRRRKSPGRPEGHAAALRPPPKIDREVPVPLEKDAGGGCLCPACRGALRDVKEHRRVVEELVPASVVVTAYATASGYCPTCKKRVESRQADQPPAADVPQSQLGLNALATAAALRVEHRLPFRQVTRVLKDVAGLRVSAGAVARQLQRLGRWLGTQWQALRDRLRGSAAVHCDETGWRVKGRNRWLWALCSKAHTLLRVDRTRAGKVVRRLLGRTFGGHLVSDFFAAYNRLPYKQQKCLTHLARELRETAADNAAFAAGDFYKKAKRLVKQMLALKAQWDELDDDTYSMRVSRLQDRLERVAREGARSNDRDVGRLGKRLLKYQKQLTAFLLVKELDGTNNAAERAIRPAVIARKISGGNRSEAGASAWAVVASVLSTARQQGRNAIDSLKTLLRAHWAGGSSDLLTAQ